MLIASLIVSKVWDSTKQINIGPLEALVEAGGKKPGAKLESGSFDSIQDATRPCKSAICQSRFIIRDSLFQV